MTTTLLRVATAFTPQAEIREAAILIREGVIQSIGPRAEVSLPSGATEIDARGHIAAPGFIDVHIHGAGGSDVMEGTDSALTTVAKTLASHGTTSFVAAFASPVWGRLSDRHGRSPFACPRRLVDILEVAAAGEKTPSVFSLSKTDEKIEEKFANCFKEIENRVVLKAKSSRS